MQGLPHGCTSLVLMVTLVTLWSATLVEGSQLRQRLADDLKPVGLRVVLPDDEATACPMVSNDISVTVRDRLATVTFSQVFVNVASNNNSVEAQYLFPVMPDMAVSSMVATTPRGEYHAEVKERGVAQQEYDAAMSRGDGAFLARYDDAQPDLLVMDVGNIPPNETVRMKVVMTVLLDVSLAHWLFELPLAFIKPYAIAGTPADAGVQEQPQVQDVPYTWSFVASFGSARPGTHVVDVRSDLYEMEKWTSDDSSTMHVRLLHEGQQPNHVLQLRVYTREDKQALNGAMVSPLSRVGNVTAQGLHVWLTPETGDVQETTFDVSAEYIFVVDRSGSMNGESMTIAKEAVQKSLSLLPASAFFNVISFGSSFEALFADGPRAATVDAVAEASRAVSTFDADLGGTEIEEPLRFIFNTPPPAEGRTRTVFLITDGQVGNEAAVVSLIGAHAARNRVFTFGIGAGVSPYIVVEGARAGGGQHYLLSGAGNYLAEAMYDSMTHSVWRGWSVEGLKLMVDEKVEVRVLTRQRLGLVYAGDTLSVTGVVEHDGDVCAYASVVVVVGVRDSRSGAVHEWRLPAYCDRSATPTDGSGLVQLSARQVLVEMEDRVRVTAELRDVMINISTRYQVLCSVTSLIAVEHREETSRQPLLRVKVPAPAVYTNGWTAPPLRVRTRTMSMTFSASPSLTLSSTEMAWILDGPTIYGATVQLAAFQCDPTTDSLSASLSPSNAPMTVQTVPSICAVFLKNKATSVSEYKTVIDTVQFTTTQTARIQLSFGVIMWSTATLKDLLMNVDDGNVFASIQSASPQTIENAYDLCRSSGFEWNLPTDTTPVVNAIIGRLVTDPGVSLPTIPIGMIRQTTGQFGWVTAAVPTYALWDTGYPQNTVLNRCTLVGANGKWTNIDCATTFTKTMCESQSYILKYTKSFVPDSTLFNGSITLRPFANASLLPSPTITIVYGVTIHGQAYQCRTADRFIMTASHDKLSVSSQTSCVLFMVGRAYQGEYNTVVQGVIFRGDQVRRSLLRFNYIFWSNSAVRNMIRDVSTGAAFATFTDSGAMTPTATYPAADPMSLLCTRNSMTVAELLVTSHASEQFRTQPTIMYMGATRTSATAFRWLSGTTMAFQLWRPLYPTAVLADNCMVQTMQRDWQSVPCTTQMPSVGCSTGSWALSGDITINLPPVAWDPTLLRPVDLVLGVTVSDTAVDAAWSIPHPFV